MIVPLLNEADAMPDLISQARSFVRQGAEVLLVDGGSIDGSVALAQAAGLTVLASEPGRARQMNHGAAATTRALLLFVHADTTLPQQALETIASSLRDTACWGRFDVEITPGPALLKVVAPLMNWRSRLTGIATGDQALFMTRAAFERVGGFPDQPLMEDIDLSTRLRRQAWPVCLRDRVKTSGRRWEKYGVWSTVFLMWRLRWAHWRGVPASVLAQRYR